MFCFGAIGYLGIIVYLCIILKQTMKQTGALCFIVCFMFASDAIGQFGRAPLGRADRLLQALS